MGTTVVRALEHAITGRDSIRPGRAMADQRVRAASRLRIVDMILSGTHEPQTSHHELLHAFAGPDTLARMDEALNREGFRTHEFGDSVLVAKASAR